LDIAGPEGVIHIAGAVRTERLDDLWHAYIGASPQEVAEVLRRWRGDDEFDPTGRSYFDRLT
jgi:hypothetical protein